MSVPGIGRRRVILGRIGAAFGVCGWVKARSYTEPPEALFGYRPLCMGTADAWREVELEAGRVTGRGPVLKLVGIDTREDAAVLNGLEIAVPRSSLPPPPPGQYYWVDLEGLEVLSPEGHRLGRVDHILDAPAHPVLVVEGEREHLVPMVRDRVLKVDLERGRITVDWQPDW